MIIDGALNEEQLVAALDTEGAVLVTAGAGSGKTRLLTHRIVHLIADNNVSPYNILAITFTNKASMEMKNRLCAMHSGAENVWVSTFHSMCARLLRRHIDVLGYNKNFTIYADDDSERAVKRIIKEAGYEGENLHKKCLNAISDAKNQGMSPEKYAEVYAYKSDILLLTDVFTKYEQELKKSNSLDFGDLLIKTYDMLAASPETLSQYRSRFKYIHVDEFQDTNVIQYNLVRLLAGSNGNVFVVGDEDQSIYGWRGADVTNMRNFIDDYNARIYKLERNYRSTKSILDAANKLIKNNTSRIDKNLWTDAGGGEPVVVYKAESDTSEADYVVNAISRMMRAGYRPSDFAVLMRINAMTRVLEQRLMQYNVAYKVYGGFKFFDRKEVKDILAYLKVLSNPADNESLLRIINFPKRGIGDGAQAQLAAYSSVSGRQLTDVILDIENNPDIPNALIKKVKPFAEVLRDLFNAKETKSVYDLAEYVVHRISLIDVYAEDTEENISRRLNISDFLTGIKEFSDHRGGGLAEYLEEVTLYTDTDEESGEAVYLSTIHSAKGMEFRVVFIVGMEEGLFPMSRAYDDESEMEEERRLMYVAITRAKEKLYMTFCSSRFMYGDRKYQLPSRFFAEIDENLINKLNPQPKTAVSGGAYGSYSQKPGAQKSPAMPQNTAKAQKNAAGDFPVGTVVKHKRFGEGVVESVADIGGNSYLTIDFAAGGKMTLSLQFAPIEKVS